MADLFDEKNISPMLLNEVKEPFDDDNYIYELKLDGIRCMAYIEPYFSFIWLIAPRIYCGLASIKAYKMCLKRNGMGEINSPNLCAARLCL